MPELPEVETICQELAQTILNQKITTVIIHRDKLRQPITPNLSQALLNQSFQHIVRRSKYLLLYTTTGCLIIHLGMTGNLHLRSSNDPATKHEHLRIVFTNDLALCYIDSRRFGLILWTTTDPFEHQLLQHLGVEPLTDDFTGEYLFSRAQKTAIPIKQLLMNNQAVVGVGNIYAAEALFAAKIHPLCPAKQLSLAACDSLVLHIKAILTEAIKYRGTTIQDYTNSHGKRGSYQDHLQVYGRANQPCLACSQPLSQMRQGGRTTVYCSHCQKYCDQ